MTSKTLKEIGKELNISRFTVARVLRGDKYVSAKTRNLVLDYLKKEPYFPNMLSSWLSEGVAKVIGLVFPEESFLSMEFYTQEIIKGVAEATKREGYHLMLFNQDDFDPAECLNLYMGKLVAGFLLPAIGKDNFPKLSKLKQKKIPTALLCSHCDGFASFDCDNVTGGYLAAKHLLDKGHRRIAFIHGHKNWVDAEDRCRGYKKALKEAGIEIREDYIQYNDGRNVRGYEKNAVGKLANLKNPPDAIFAANDRIALAAMAAVKEMNRNIPGDIAIIGFDNIPGCENFSPALSSVSQPIKQMAYEAVKGLIETINSGKKSVETRFFKPELMVRSST